jgi:hypothetical protein
MAIRFHLDENVSNAVASALRRRGVDVSTSFEAGLIGANDRVQLNHALVQARVFVSHDDDFTRLHAAGVPHSGICYCPKDKYPIGEFVHRLILVYECLTADEMNGHFEFL